MCFSRFILLCYKLYLVFLLVRPNVVFRRKYIFTLMNGYSGTNKVLNGVPGKNTSPVTGVLAVHWMNPLQKQIKNF